MFGSSSTTSTWGIWSLSVMGYRGHSCAPAGRRGHQPDSFPGAGGYEPDAGLRAGLGELGELGEESGLITISLAS